MGGTGTCSFFFASCTDVDIKLILGGNCADFVFVGQVYGLDSENAADGILANKNASADDYLCIDSADFLKFKKAFSGNARNDKADLIGVR